MVIVVFARQEFAFLQPPREYSVSPHQQPAWRGEGGRKELSAVEISVGGYSIVLPWATTCGYQVARVVELANTGLISENERVEAIAV